MPASESAFVTTTPVLPRVIPSAEKVTVSEEVEAVIVKLESISPPFTTRDNPCEIVK